MNLIIDIGNTRSKIAVFDQQVIIEKIITQCLDNELLDKVFNQYPIKAVILSVVGKRIDNTIEKKIKAWKKPFIHLAYGTSLPIKNNYKTPETLGQDRLAGVIGATHLFPNENCLVIDAGTCITYDFITATQIYIGGSISPGLSMRYRAMHEFTAALPLLNKQRLNTFVGYNTVTSMQTGVEFGLSFEIQGFIENYFNNYGQIKVIITGGDATYLASQVKSKTFVNPDLILIGLNKILTYNAKLLE